MFKEISTSGGHSYAGQLFFYQEIGILLGIVELLKMYLYSCIALISFLIVFQNSMTLLGFGRDHLREAAVTHQCNGGRRFSLRMKPHQPNGEVRGRRGASTVTGMVQDDESCRCTCRASFFSTSAPVSPSHRIARNPGFRARTAGLRRTRRLTLIMATPTGFQSLWTAM